MAACDGAHGGGSADRAEKTSCRQLLLPSLRAPLLVFTRRAPLKFYGDRGGDRGRDVASWCLGFCLDNGPELRVRTAFPREEAGAARCACNTRPAGASAPNVRAQSRDSLPTRTRTRWPRLCL